jgi:extracellular matrix regulatory protein B
LIHKNKQAGHKPIGNADWLGRRPLQTLFEHTDNPTLALCKFFSNLDFMNKKLTDTPKNNLFVPLSSGFSADRRTLIGIFDLDTSTKSPDTRKFLRLCEKKGKLSTDSKDLPKSFAVCDGYITLLQTASNQLAKKFR